MSEWQPIETAPKDGTPILICKRDTGYGSLWGRVRCTRWSKKGFWRFEVAGHYEQDRGLLGWMPLPEPLDESATSIPTKDTETK